jgi:DNA-binding transcriptional ArsR family regulator
MIDADVALRALAHPGRRAAVALVADAARSAGELAEACGWTRPATSQHLKVLLDAGLIDVRRQGNRRLYRARQDGLAQLRAFLDEFWAGRLGALTEHVDDAGQQP